MKAWTGIALLILSLAVTLAAWPPASVAASPMPNVPEKQVEFRNAMRALWEDHIVRITLFGPASTS